MNNVFAMYNAKDRVQCKPFIIIKILKTSINFKKNIQKLLTTIYILKIHFKYAILIENNINSQ